MSDHQQPPQFAIDARVGRKPPLVRSPPGPTSPAARILRGVRWGITGFGLLMSWALLVTCWLIAEDSFGSATGHLYVESPEQRAMKTEAEQVRVETRGVVAETEQWESALATAAAVKPAKPSGTNRSHYLNELHRLLGRHVRSRDWHTRRLRQLTLEPADRPRAERLVRGYIRSGEAELSRACQLVEAVQSPPLRAELLGMLTSADDVRLRFPKTGTGGVIELLSQSPPDEIKRLVPVLIELSEDAPNDPGNRLLGDLIHRQLGGNPNVPELIFHSHYAVQSLARINLSNDGLWAEAIKAVEGDRHDHAFAAAKWISQQRTDSFHKEQVVAAVKPVLWLTLDGSTFPAFSTLTRWGDASHASAVADVGRQAGAERMAAVVCFTLYQWKPEMVAAVVKERLSNRAWNERLASRLNDRSPSQSVAAIRRIVVAQLGQAVPADAHIPYLPGLRMWGTAGDVVWLRDYQRRLPAAKLSPDSILPSQVDSTIKKLASKRRE